MPIHSRIFALAAIASLLTLTIVHAADAPSGDTAADEKALQGTWVVESAEYQATPSPDPVGHKFSFAAGKLTLQRKDKDQPAQFAYALDAAATPKEIALTPLDDSGKADPARKIRGIYRVEGNTLRICMNDRPGPQPAPAEFKTDKYSSDVLLVLKRQK